MSGSYKFRGENPWHNFHKLHVPEDVNFSNHANSWYSQSNGSNRNKESMGYGGLAYYDNATYAGPHSKGSFTGGSSDHPDYTYRRTKNRCCIAIGVLVFILAVGIGVFLGVYFGLMDKPDTVSDTSQYEKGKFQTSLKINQNWDPKYGDPNSPEYQGLINNLDNQLTSMYQSSSIKNDFQGVDVTSVSQGSIIVVCIITVAQTSQLTPSVLQSVTRASIEQIQNDASSTSALLKAVDVSLISVSSVPLTTTLLPPTTTQAKTSTMAKTTEKPTTEAVTSTIKQTTTEKHTTPPPMTTAPQPSPSTTPPPPPSTTTPPTTTPDPITAPPPSPTTAPPPPPTTAPPPPPSTTTPPTTTPEPTTAPPPPPSTTTPPTTTPEPTTAPPPPSSTTTPPTTTPELTTVPPPPPTTTTPPTTTPESTTAPPPPSSTTTPPTTTPELTTVPPPPPTTPPTTTPESTTAPPPPPSTTTPPTTTTGAAVTQPHTTMELSTDLTTKKTFLDGNPCTNHSLLRDISLQCFGNFANDLMTESTNDGKCNVLLGKVLPCIVTKIQTDYGKTCTKKEQHNIIIENRDTIKNVVTFDPQLCLPTPSCSSIESIVYYVPIVCEEQTNELVKSGSCSDFSDVLKCYYYHIGSSCNTTDLYSSISNSYTQWSQMIGQPFPNSCSVSIDWIDSSAKTSLCSDPDAVQVIVNMYCPNDLLEFIMAGTAEKCMKANNLVVCAENQMNLVLKTSCIVDDIYNMMAGYQSNITGVSNQPSIIDCHHRQEQTTDEMTTTEAATTTATIVIVEGEFEANMKVNQTWDPVFEDKNSTEYKDLTENFRNQTLALYNYKNSTVQVEDIVVLDVSEGSLVFDFLIILVKTLPDIAEWTAEKLIEKTVEIIETIQKDPEVVLDIIKNVDTKKIKVNQKVEKLTECDRVGYIKPIVQDRCNNALTRLFQVPDNQTKCEIFEQVVGCVVFHAQQCSVAKVTRTISKHFNAMKSSVPNAGRFEPSTCYADEEDLVLPTLMPLTAQVKPCIHPDVLSYIMNFDCHYDAIPHMTRENATMEENCRFYWMTAACVYQKAQENQLLQSFGQCSFEETKQVLVNYADKIFKVRPTTSAAQCYAYMFKKEECSTYMYVPDMYNSFGICFMEWFQLKLGMRGDFDLSNMTCRMYKEAAQCLYRHYQIKGNNSCDWRDFGKNAAWMINSGIAQWSQAMNVKMNEADAVENCIDEATSDSDFGHSICVDGEALILSSIECISQTLMKAEGGVCQSLKNHYIPCVQSKIPPGLSCTRDDIEQSIMMEADLIEKLTRKTVVISQCTGDKDKASNMFNITMTLMMDWSPVYGDVNSVEYQNLTSEFLRQLNIAVAEFASMIEYMKVVDVRSGSVVIVTEVKYTFSVTGSNILLETQKFVSDAKMNPNSTLTLLSIVDMNSIQVDAYDVGPGDYCMAYREEVMNVTTCGMAMFGFLNRSDIDQQVLCSAYNTYLSCLKIHVERSGKTCKMASLNSWIPITLSYYLTPGTVEQVGKCQVDDDNKISCDDTGLLEQMALRSACAGYAPYLNHQECSAVWQPYVKCVADLFPSCDIRDVAEKLVSHTNISNLVPSGFDVMDKCFPDGPVLEESSLFSITLKFMIDWVPELMDKDSDRYRNLTTEIMREMEMAAAAANYTDMIDYMKIIEVRQGSVIVEFEVRYNYVIKTTDIMSGTQQLVMGAKQDPDTPLRYLKTVDMDSISVKALKDGTEMDYCGVYREDILNNTQCVTAIYGLMDRTSIPQHELCGAYDVYLMCIRERVEKRGLKCKLTSLHKWVPQTFQYYLQSVSVDQVNKCDVDDDNTISCHDTGLLEQMALHSVCGMYTPHLYSQDCSNVWQPYVKCVADLFPSCNIRDVAEKLVYSTNISHMVAPGFDVVNSCFSDGPVLEESSLFSITLKFMIDWVPELMDKDSDRYRNLTTEIMREMEMAAAAANYTDMIDYMKIMEVRQGSVIVEFEVRYNYVIKTTDIMSGTQQLVMGAKQDPDTPLRYLKTVDMDSISVKALKDGTEMDYCGVYREDILNNTQCVTAIYGFMDRTSIPQHELCGAYDVYLMCIRERVEKRGLKCKLTSLHKWVPQTFQYYLQSVSVDQVNKCDVDDDNTISCDDTGLLEQMALRSVCGMYTPHLYSQDCSNVWQPYVKCVADLFPSCNIRDVAEKLVHSTNISHMVAPGFDVVNSCFSDGSVLVESSLFSITLKFMIDWLPELMDKDSNEYRNLTTEIMREMEMAAAAANYTDMIDYMKIIEVRQGSVIVEFEVRYNYVIKTTDIMSGTQQLVMGAKQDPDTQMRYLKTVDMDSISVKALKDGTEMDYCGVYREDILNNTQCVTAIYGLMDRTSIPQHELCGAYDVYLMCIRERVEKRGLKCKLTSLHKWVPQTFQYYLQSVSVDQVNKCDVDDDNTISCDDTGLLEQMALHSVCGMYTPHLYSQDCSNVWQPYVKCVADLFPSCNIRDVAEKLVYSTNISHMVAPGFDVVNSCFSDGPVLEESLLFSITLKFMIDWVPELMDKDSDRYRNLTTEIMREMEMAAAAANYTDMIDYMKIMEVRQGSVIVEFEVRYNYVIKTTDIMSGTQQLVMGAKQDPDTPLRYLKTVDMDSISVKALKDGTEMDYCGVYREDILNNTQCVTAIYGLMDRTSIPQHELCGAYDVYLMCIRERVEKRGLKCKLTSLHKWVPQTFQYYLQSVSVDQVNKCDVDDDNTISCDDTGLLEQMALHSVCGMYTPHLYSQDCSNVWQPYVKCVADLFPSCNIRDVAEKLVYSTNISHMVAPGFDVVNSCFSDGPVLEESLLFSITLKFMIDWVPELMDKDSDRYRNLTTEIMREMEMAAAAANYTDMIDYMKIMEVRQGSVIVEFEVRYNYVIKTTDIMSGTQQLVMGAKQDPDTPMRYLKTVDMDSITVKALKDGTEMDYCGVYREDILNNTQCVTAIYGLMDRTSIPQHELCGAYDVYLMCIRERVEKRGLKCKLTSLHKWVPQTFQYYLQSVSVDQVNKCDVDDDNTISCDDTGLLEQMALRSVCGMYTPHLYSQDCSNVWQPYVKCVADLFPSCNIRDVAEKLVHSTNISHMVAPGFDVVNSCFSDGSVLVESSLFSITLKFMIDWLPELMDKDSNEYRNLTTEIMREMEMAAAAANYTDMIDYMKIIEVRQGSVIVEFEVRYNYVIKTTDIMSGTQQLVMGAKQDPDTPMRYLKTVDMDSISVKALKDGTEMDYCGVYREDILNNTQCVTAIYGLMDRTSIPQHELCGAYDVYLMCIRERVEKRGLKCKLTSLHKWVPQTFQYYLQSVSVDQVNKCDVDDDNTISCDDTGLLEQMALRSVCGMYTPHLYSQDCSNVWQPYVKCVADLFPSCNIRDVAEKLVYSTNISHMVAPGFDVVNSCFSDGPVLEESSLFSITLKFMIDWVPELMDKDSDRYRNLTTEIMREMEMAAAAANYTDMIDYMKIIEVRQGSVIVEFEVRYNYVIKTTDIMSGTQQLVMGAKQDPDTPLRYLKTVDMDSISVKALKDGTEMDYCGVYREDILNNTQCVTAIYGLMDRTSIPQHELCGAYDVYLMCIRERVEKRGLKCKLTSLHKWVPQTFQYYLQSVSVDQVNKCDVDDDNTISCDDTGLLEQMALRSVCGMYTPHLYSQDCSNVWQPYVKCVADLFPSCNIRDLAEKLVYSTNISHMVAPGFDVVNSCFSGDASLDKSNIFRVTFKLMIDWIPDYSDENSTIYQNLTEALTREMYLAASMANYSMYLDYIKVVALRQGSVYVVYELKYIMVIHSDDVISGAQYIINMAKMDPNTPLQYITLANINSTTVEALKGDVNTGYCSMYKEEIMNNTRCGMALYGFMNRSNVGQSELCQAYNIYVTCLKETVERSGQKCDLAALHGWVSTVVSVYVPTPAVSNINQCPLVERGPSCDVDDLEAMAFQSACAGYTIYLSYPMCSLWMPYIQCIAGMFPQCSERDVADKLMSTNVSALVPPGFDVMDTCFQDKKSASKYRISMKFDIMWIPMYHDPDSEAYRNLTREIMSQMMMAVGNYSDTITRMEIVDLRPGSVIVVFEVEYAMPIDKEDIRQTSVEIVMAARMMPGLYLIRTVDPTSIVVEALDDGLLPSGYDCTQYNQQTVEINPACSVSMAYLYNRTSISPEEICRYYDVALTCIQQSVEMKTMKECKKTDLHTWMPYVVQGALPNIKSSQLSVCPVTNEYFYCNNTELFESYALGACYSPFTQILQYPMCGEVWVPYINCTAGLFPQCPIKAVAESLMDSPKFTSIVPKAFDVLDTCFPDNELPSYMVSLRFEMPWKREFEDEDSEEYRNLTSEVMRQMMIATANYTDMIKDIKIYEVREGSVIIVLEVQLFQASSESDVQNFVADLVWSIKKDPNSRLHLLKLIDPYRIEIDEVPDWLKDDVCEHYRQEILIESGATCGLVLYGLANQTDDIFCTSYDVYMTCIKDREEEKWHRECKKSSLNQWLPIMIHSFLPQIPIEKYGMCNVTRDIDVCTDVPSVSAATLHSVCAFPFLFLHMAPTCNATVGAFNCVMSILPSCDPIQVITTMKKSSNMSALIPPSLDPEDCYRDICENYTDLVEEDKDCIDIFIDSASPYDVQCRRYNVYAHCLLNSIRKQGRVCEMDSLLTWLPDYLEMRQNVSDLQNCSLTRGSLCYDLDTIETVARDSQCRDRNHLLSIYPSCLNAKMLIKCMMGILGDCNNYTLANMLTMSNHSLVPSSLDLNYCLRAPGFDLFQVNFTINTTWTDELHDWNSTEYIKLADTITQQTMDLFTNEKLNLFKQIAKVEIIGFSQGSVKVHSQIMIDYDSPFSRTLTAEDLKQEMTMAIDWLQSFAPSKPNYFTSVDPQSIEVWGIGEPDRHMTTPYQPYPTYPTTVTTTITPNCSSPAYIKLVIGYCESAKSQLQKSLFKSSNITCRILFDLIGCVMFNTKFMCSEQEVISVIERDPYEVLEHYLDTSSCYAPGSNIILPTILPLNMSLSPCSSPDVIKYILNYDCYYYAVMDSLQGTSQIESCKFYWYSTSCVYKAIEGSTTLPRCSHSEIMDVFTKYETQLFQVSPANVDLKYCTENGKGTCSKSMFGPKFYEVAMTCYGNALSNRYLAMYYALNIDKDKCLIYEEMYECMYRALRNNCSKAEMEREGIWITNTFNNVMTVAMGQNLKEKETVFECIANSSNKDSFGQDICYDGPGLIMNSVNCALEIMDCRSLMDKYLPCMVNALAIQGIRCDKHVLVSSVLKESALLSRLISHVGDLSGCGKDGICPSVSNSSDSHGNQSFCEILCSDDFSCPYNEKCCSNGCGAYCLTPEAKTTMMPYTPATSVFTTVKGKEAAFVVSIPFNLPWDQAYDDRNSDTYINLASMISTEMYSMVGGVPGLTSLNVTGFRNGSVVADILVIFSQALYTADEVYYETMHAIKDLLPNSTLFQKVIFEKVSVVPYRDPSAKEGSCPAVVGSGICLYNCSSDQQCGGPQKCCFNGCGYVCVDPVSGKSSDRFNVSLVFDIPWDDVYKQNETYKAAIVNEIYTMIGNNSIRNYIKSVEAKVIKPGSVMVFLEVQFWKVLEAYEVEQQLEMMIQAVQWVPMFPWLQKVRSVKVNSLPAWNNIVTTTPPPTGMVTTTMHAPDPTPSPPPVQPMCQGSWGSCLSNTDCHLVKWSYNYGLQTIAINITAAVGPDKWLGVGFNKEKKMLDADAIIGWVTPEGTVVVSDRKNGPYFYPLIDTNQNVNNIQGHRIGGITSISFTRNRITDDGTDDLAFNATNGAYFLFPLGGTYSSDGTLKKHDKTPAISADMFTFPCPEVCKDLQFFRMWAPRMCAKEVSSFKETDDQLTFCRNLGLTSECIQRNMPLHGCSSEIEESVYITLIGLLNELIPFDIMPKVTGCLGR